MIGDVGGRLVISPGPSHLTEIAARGVPVPTYDRDLLRGRIVHIGVGGFHRAHFALYCDDLAEAGSDWGIVGLGLLPQDAEIAETLRDQGYLYTLIEKGNGEPSARLIGSIIGFVHAPGKDDPAVVNLIASSSTAVLSLTVTEAGYAEPAGNGAPPTFDRIASGLAARRARGGGPLTILSFDNMPGNGTAARRATLSAAGRVDTGLAEWVTDNCTFPNSMVDRITPVTSREDRAWLVDSTGIEDRWPVVAEPFRQWVVEDDFAAGRPPWETVGALFTDRVHDWELYKLRMLNAAHSSMAYLSALAGITFVDEAMAVPTIKTFLEALLYREAMPTLDAIPGHPREDYVASVLERFENRGVRDQIARLCIDGSAKFPTFLIPTIARQLEMEGPVDRAATALAGWARYLGVVDPADQAFDTSGDAARRHGAAALADPLAFLDYSAVFPSAVSGSERFRAAFAQSYECIVDDGPMAAMEKAAGAERTGGAL
jgi:mannitol 2-dehydrogenase